MDDTGEIMGAGVIEGETETGEVGRDGMEDTGVVDEIGGARRGAGESLADGTETGGVTADTGGDGVVGAAGLGDGDGLQGAAEVVPTWCPPLLSLRLSCFSTFSDLSAEKDLCRNFSTVSITNFHQYHSDNPICLKYEALTARPCT